MLSEIKPLSKWYEAKRQLKEGSKKIKTEPDILDLCHIVPKEVINLTGGKGYNVDLDADDDDYSDFRVRTSGVLFIPVV